MGTGATRSCPVCGAPLDGRRAHAVTCSQSCRRERSRLLALLDGKRPESYGSVLAYVGRERRAPRPVESVREGGQNPALDSPARRDTRSTRADEFVLTRCRPAPGQVTTARAAFAAYLAWAQDHEPGEPLSYTAFLRVVEAGAPIERRVKLPTGGRGRPRLAFAGFVLTGDQTDADAA